MNLYVPDNSIRIYPLLLDVEFEKVEKELW